MIFMIFANFGKQSLKVSKSRKQFMVFSILPKNERKITNLSIVSLENNRGSDLLFIFGENGGFVINYHTRAIIIRGLYISNPLFAGQKRLFKGLFS